MVEISLAPPGNHAAKGENKPQPVVSEETGLLDSNVKNIKEMLDMFKKVIVPLDGSPLAENTLPFVKNLAKEGCVEEVVLLNVVEIPIMWIS